MTMTRIDPDDLLIPFSEFLVRQIGLHFPRSRWPELLRGMEGVTREFRCVDTTACIRRLMSSHLCRSDIETLARHLTVGETYFFREPQVFERLQTHVLPPLIQSRRQSGQHFLRLWSAACASGEEAYSLAILLHRMIPDISQWNIVILGTDINPRALEKAATGIYDRWSFRSAPPWLLADYFRAAGGSRYEISASVRSMVSFSYLNLAEDVYPSLANNTNGMDIIFCRNVLMYFEPALAASVVRKHHQALAEGGWLAVSPSEISQPAFSCFEACHFPDAILHRKAASDITQKRPAPSPTPEHPLRPAKASKPLPVNTAPGNIPAAEAPDPGYRQAQKLYQQGRYAEAATETSRLLARQIRNAEAMSLLARIHANRGELADALHWCEQAIDADRLNPVGHYLRAAILMEHGRLEEAMLAYKRTLYLDQDFVIAHFALGNLFRRQNRPREAGKHFENALQLLHRHENDDVLPESDGITAGRLAEIIRHDMAQRNEMA